MSCEAWPEEYDGSGHLLYHWRIRVGLVDTVYPLSANPFVALSCRPTQRVTATVTVWNGGYSSTDVVGYTCGGETQ